MPLPANSSISLQGHSRPGEGITTMPKIAMVVRMTEETLDALQNLSAADRMDFEFGEKPGIIVHGQHFPMRYDKEKDNQELFIRTTMAARPNAPLKLNANVIGKFAVKQVLSDQISQRLHNSTAAVAKRPKIQVIEPSTAGIPQHSGPPKKKVPKSMPTIVKSYPAQTSTPNIIASPSSVSLPKDVVLVYRQRLIHYLALGAAAEEDIFKEYGGKDIDRNTKAALTDILNEVAELEQVSRKAVSSTSVAKWQLKPRTWLEVRPYQYQDFTDNVRTKVARSARSWLQSLRIPESDPSWDHVKFRDNGSGGAGSGTNTAQRSVNGTSSAAAKKAKAKTGKTKEIDMKIKSEAAPPTRAIPTSAALPPKPSAPMDRMTPPVRINKVKEQEAETEKEEGELSASQTPPRVPAVQTGRRMPGSRPPGASTPAMPPPPAPPLSQPMLSSQSSSSTSTKRTGPVDARGPRRAPPEPSERARPAPPIPPPAPVEKKTLVHVKEEVVRVKKERASPLADSGYAASGSTVRSAKEREPMKRERERESDRESMRPPRRERERERESDRETPRGREGDRKPKDKDTGREREREKERPKERVKDREQVPLKTSAKTSAKRKLSESSDEESSDWGYEDRKNIRKSSVTASTTKGKRERESVPLKSSAATMKTVRRDSTPPKRIKRDASPLPPTKIKSSADRKAIAGSSSSVQKMKKEVKPEGGSSRLSNSKSLKRRRSSIDFTSSSESEDEAPRPKASKSATKVSTSSHLLSSKPSQTKAAASSATAAPVVRTRPVKPLPKLSKNEALRLRYSDKYEEYILAFQKLNTLKKKFTTIVRYGSESLSGESDVDNDMISLDELQELAARHQRLRTELEGIEKEYLN